MLHGVIFAKDAWDLNQPAQGTALVHEIRTAFGAGTALQELYITPALLEEQDWDALAARVITLEAVAAFEIWDREALPKVGTLKLAAVYADQRVKTLFMSLQDGMSTRLELEPFEVLVFEGAAVA
eukprot:UC1_evm2s2031